MNTMAKALALVSCESGRPIGYALISLLRRCFVGMCYEYQDARPLHPGTRDIHLTLPLSRTGSLALAAIVSHTISARPDPSTRLRTPLFS